MPGIRTAPAYAAARAATRGLLCAMALLAWAAPAAAQLKPIDRATLSKELDLPPGDYYSVWVLPFPLRFYKKEADGNLYPWDCEMSSMARSRNGLLCYSYKPLDSIGPVSFAEADALAQAYPKGLTTPIDSPSQYWSGLKDLVPDGRAHGRWPLLYKVVDNKAVADRNLLANKRVLLVLSSDSAQAFEQLDEMQRELADWAATQADPRVRAAADSIAQLPTRKLVASNVTKSLYSRRASVTYADDLSQLRSGGYDFAMVVDVVVSVETDKLLALLDQELEGRGRRPKEDLEVPFSGTRSWVVLDRDLRVFFSNIGYRGTTTSIPRGAQASRAQAVADELTFIASVLRSLLNPDPDWMSFELPDDSTY